MTMIRPAVPAVSFARLTPDLMEKQRRERQAIWAKLPPFDLAKARAGHPYVYLYDLPQGGVAYCDIRPIAAPNEAWLVWSGEWNIYSFAELDDFFRMVDLQVLGPVEVKR